MNTLFARLAPLVYHLLQICMASHWPILTGSQMLWMQLFEAIDLLACTSRISLTFEDDGRPSWMSWSTFEDTIYLCLLAIVSLCPRYIFEDLTKILAQFNGFRAMSIELLDACYSAQSLFDISKSTYDLSPCCVLHVLLLEPLSRFGANLLTLSMQWAVQGAMRVFVITNS